MLASHPWMTFQLFKGWSLGAVLAKHFQNQIFEFGRKVLTTCFLPVSIGVSFQKEAVEVLIFLGFFEREYALHDDEQDNSGRKDVDLFAIVLLSFFDFWCHVCHGSSIGFEIMNFLESSKAKICHFQFHVVVDQNVFKL